MRTVSLAFAALALCACTNTFFSGTRKNRPAPQGNEEVKPVGQPTATSPNESDAVEIPENKRGQVNIKVVRLNSDSWWKNCVDVGVFLGGRPTTEGMSSFSCNKGAAGAMEKVLTVHKEECNTLRVRLSIFENKGPDCSHHPDAVCEGPYADSPDARRSMDVADDRPLFQAFDARKVADAVAEPGFARLISPKDKATITNAAAGVEPALWLRVFMEDQPYRNYQRFLSAKNPESVRSTLGIDFDDYVLDIQAPAGIKLKLEGDNSWMGEKPSAYITPPNTCL